MTHPNLFDWVPPAIFGDRHGETFVPSRDRTRLNAQSFRVFKAMQSGEWRTLREIAEETHDPEASVSARLRDLRKPEFGGFRVERRFVYRGLWQYRLIA